MDKALARTDEQRLEAERLKREAKEQRLAARQAHLKSLHALIEIDSVKKVRLRKYAFKTDAELQALHLSPEEIALVRQWELPKKSVAFAIESAAQHVTAKARGEADKKGPQINVENMTIRLPEKGTADFPEAVVIDVEAQHK